MRIAVVLLALLALPNLVSAQRPVKEVPQQEIDDAVDKAVRALKNMRQGTMWKYQEGGEYEKNIGATALVGLALLQAEVPADDPAVAAVLGAVTASTGSLTETYSIALAIMFLDRHGGQHNSHIQRLAKKLIDYQNKTDHGWPYGARGGAPTDNSNTQFAILGLWAARKHGVPGVHKCLLDTASRFEDTQDRQTGGWGYGGQAGPMTPPTYTMTCAGLLGLFLGYGSERETVLTAADRPQSDDAKPTGGNRPRSIDELKKDERVKRAFKFLGSVAEVGLGQEPHWVYLLWSIERVCVTYKVKELGGVDWYHWGSRLFLRAQKRDGSWDGENGPVVDTSFAILFLCKADLVGEVILIAEKPDEKPPDPPAKPATPAKAPAAKKPAPGVTATRLAKQLSEAAADMKSKLIDEYEKRDGAEYTDALALAIPMLRGPFQDKARLALVERLKRQSAAQLASPLASELAELRRAAAVAAGRNRLEALVPDLIKLLADKEPLVQDAAHDALQIISGKDLKKDAKAWTEWWKTRKSR